MSFSSYIAVAIKRPKSPVEIKFDPTIKLYFSWINAPIATPTRMSDKLRIYNMMGFITKVRLRMGCSFFLSIPGNIQVCKNPFLY